MNKKTFISGIALLLGGLSLGFSLATIAHAQTVSTGVVAAPPAVPIEITPQMLPSAAAGSSYYEPLTVVTSESGPFYWSVNGMLPSGLILNADASDSGASISGVPLFAGTSSFSISATNHNIAATQTYFFTVAAGPSTSISEVAVTSSIQAQVAAIATELQQIQGTVTTPSDQGVVLGTSIGPLSGQAAFYRDLTVRDVGPDVLALQQFLNREGYIVAVSGSGSPGNETYYFGTLTQAALARWQQAAGISPATGYFGLATRDAISASS